MFCCYPSWSLGDAARRTAAGATAAARWTALATAASAETVVIEIVTEIVIEIVTEIVIEIETDATGAGAGRETGRVIVLVSSHVGAVATGTAAAGTRAATATDVTDREIARRKGRFRYWRNKIYSFLAFK